MSTYDDASLILIPSGVKDGKVYSAKPTNGDGDFTLTRASEATRLVDGVVTKVRTNSILQSNDFSNVIWLKTSVTLTGGQADKDGGSNAWKFESQGSASYILQLTSISGVYTRSFYAKAGNVNWLSINSGGSQVAYFDVQNGVVGTTSSGAIDAKIEAAGNGWYRCSVIINSQSHFYLFVANADNSATTNSGDYILIQNAQLEAGLVATPYIATTTVAVSEGPVANMPRLNSVAGGCPSLLLEPQRTNLTVHSEYIPAWANSTADIAATSTLSPDGTANAYRVTGTPAGLQAGSLSSTTATTVLTTSIWVRKVSGSDTATHIDVNNVGTTISITTDWARYELTSTASSGVARLYIAVAAIGDVIEVWGAQTEVGSYATSYIPTYGTAATAAIEQAVLPTTSFDLTGDWSILLDFGNVYKTSTASEYMLHLDTDTNDFYLYAAGTTTAGLNIYLPSQGGYVFGSSDNAAWGVDASKICVTYDAATGRLVYFINGSKYNEQTSALSFGNSASSSKFYAGGNNIVNIKKYLFFESALTDAEAITLTTL